MRSCTRQGFHCPQCQLSFEDDEAVNLHLRHRHGIRADSALDVLQNVVASEVASHVLTMLENGCNFPDLYADLSLRTQLSSLRASCQTGLRPHVHAREWQLAAHLGATLDFGAGGACWCNPPAFAKRGHQCLLWFQTAILHFAGQRVSRPIVAPFQDSTELIQSNLPL